VPEASDSRRKESVARTLTVALVVSLVCSALVASAAVLLGPLQARNATLDRQRTVLEVAGLYEPAKSVEQAFEHVEVRVVDLATGRYAGVAPSAEDPLTVARDPELGADIPPDLDSAKIGRRPRYMTVYLVRQGRDLQRIVLPIYGHGLWGMIYGYLALEGDANTVADVKFYQHSETPGLGARIDDPQWRALWHGKLAYDAQGQAALRVIKGHVQGGWSGASSAAAANEIDGISGATLTGRGVSGILHYWLGPDGFGPYLQRVWKGRG
jgi:Na+-transporting NADH:ubiquinone oxidoreductase subunit C